MPWYKNLETLQHDQLYLQYEHIVRKGQAKCNTDYDSYTCNREKFDFIRTISSPLQT